MSRPVCLGLLLGCMLPASTLGFVPGMTPAPSTTSTALHMSPQASPEAQAKSADTTSQEPLLLRAAKGLVSMEVDYHHGHIAP